MHCSPVKAARASLAQDQAAKGIACRIRGTEARDQEERAIASPVSKRGRAAEREREGGRERVPETRDRAMRVGESGLPSGLESSARLASPAAAAAEREWVS